MGKLMTRLTYCRWLVAGALVAALATSASAAVDKLDLYLYGGITGASKKQIRRILSPYADADAISFRQMVRPDGTEHPWVTVVTIEPRGAHLSLYAATRAIRDARGVNDGRILWKTDLTATGDLRAHYGYTRRSFGWIPQWTAARGMATSGLWHHLYANGSGERVVFHENEAYDRLRLAPHDGGDVKIRGRIAGFDGPYPVVVLGEYEDVADDAGAAGQAVDAADGEIPQRTEAEGAVRRGKRPNRRY
jgi:hypothetical protein